MAITSVFSSRQFSQNTSSSSFGFDNFELPLKNTPSSSFFDKQVNSVGLEGMRIENIDLYALRSMVFEDILEHRIQYITTLKDLPNNWISGKSKKPDTFVINISISFLRQLATIFRHFKFLPPPVKIVMGPIPKGGISFELYDDHSNVIYLSIYNTMKFRIEYQHKNQFYKISEVNKNNFLTQLMSSYQSLIESYL